ncbi:alpha-L-arabinofuranosidase-like protein [Asticcacaulis biprosthecium C19]|uniref:Alpha-L-arabinofuranosidase-like protein n=1 Tax=Asticcacaulis biprosthecium C19 TaxID=715226 RepID=F4QKS8_9CAUL|nr:hypothetical protein [Asticcacaulis biprosthecium]EGF93380.1 alpha-L-arabinofuranosidase-like protein [Asticcacaulis biprosthecium C19]
MSNMNRRLFTAAFAAMAFAGPVFAQETAPAAPQPMVIYDDVLAPGWNNWSWAKTTLSTDIGSDVKPISMQSEPWQALFLQHAPFSTAGYTKLTFYVNGGPTGGQTISVKALIGDKPVDPGYTIRLNANTWNVVEVPLADLGAVNQTISGLWWQAQGQPVSTWYITVIQLE